MHNGFLRMGERPKIIGALSTHAGEAQVIGDEEWIYAKRPSEHAHSFLVEDPQSRGKDQRRGLSQAYRPARVPGQRVGDPCGKILAHDLNAIGLHATLEDLVVVPNTQTNSCTYALPRHVMVPASLGQNVQDSSRIIPPFSSQSSAVALIHP